MNLHSAIYISKALTTFDNSTINSIVTKSQYKNSLLNITGYLYFENNYFLQYLESENKEDLDQLIKIINKDQRHQIIHCIYSPYLNERRFKTWDMALIHKKQLIKLKIESEIITYMKWLKNMDNSSSNNLWELVDTLSKNTGILSLI